MQRQNHLERSYMNKNSGLILEHEDDGLCPGCASARWMCGNQGYCRHQDGRFGLVAFLPGGGEHECKRYEAKQ